MASPRKLRPEIALAIVNARREGKTLAECAKLAGCSKTSLVNWQSWGAENPNSVFGVFARAMDQAIQQNVQARVDDLTEALLRSNPEYAKALRSSEMEVV